jgi:acetolactate synthase-1/2/3 large subunit
MTEKPAGLILAQALALHGVMRVFCVPGESFLPLLDGLYSLREQIHLVVCRHESGAANMAEAHGKLTGTPGVCVVTRGPGASNAAIGLHTAYQDSTPMVLLIGQVGSDFVEREAFQEVDYRRMFGQMAKWVGQIDRADRIDEMISHAFHLAVSGRPGPVVLALPEDMLADSVSVSNSISEAAPAPRPLQPYQRVAASPALTQLQELGRLVQNGKRPLLLLGGGGWNAAACTALADFAESYGIAVATSFRCQDLIDNHHPCYIGHAGIGPHKALAQAIRHADPLVVIGARLGEMTTSGYTLVESPRPAQTLIHVHAGAEELGRVYQADLLINSGMPEFAQSLPHVPLLRDARWARDTADLHAAYLADSTATVTAPSSEASDYVDLGIVVQQLQEALGEDAVITNGAGNYAGWLHRFWRYRGFRSQLAPTSGAMGYGLPAAVAAKLAEPKRPVVCFAGDGCFLMTGQELATAVQYQAGVLVLICNNGMYGTIRMHQERHYPQRVWGTELNNPNFAALAQAYGAFGTRVRKTSAFLPALTEALAALESGRPAVIELCTDPQRITSRAAIADIQGKAQS